MTVMQLSVQNGCWPEAPSGAFCVNIKPDQDIIIMIPQSADVKTEDREVKQLAQGHQVSAESDGQPGCDLLGTPGLLLFSPLPPTGPDSVRPAFSF